MNDPTLDKAATRIQASYRGYKTRKDLGSASTQDQQQNSSNIQEEDDNAHDKSRTSIFNKFLLIFYFFIFIS
jgi:hypothetical protein